MLSRFVQDRLTSGSGLDPDDTAAVARELARLQKERDRFAQMLVAVVDWSKALRWDDLPPDTDAAKRRLLWGLDERLRCSDEALRELVHAVVAIGADEEQRALYEGLFRGTLGSLNDVDRAPVIQNLLAALDTLVSLATPPEKAGVTYWRGRYEVRCRRCGATEYRGKTMFLAERPGPSDRGWIEADLDRESVALHECTDGGLGKVDGVGLVQAMRDGTPVPPILGSTSSEG